MQRPAAVGIGQAEGALHAAELAGGEHGHAGLR